MKKVMGTAVALLASVSAAGMALAEYPERPVSIIEPWPPGDVDDQLLRVIAELAPRDGLERPLDLGAHDVDVDAGEPQGDDDVAVEDRRVDAVPADGLQGDLGGQLGDEAGLEDRGLAPHLAVFGE